MASLTAAALAAAPEAASAQGLTLTASPSARWVEWDKGLAFDRTRLIGGAVDLGFGRYVGLSGFYHQATGVETRLSGLGLALPSGDPVQDQMLDVAKMGGALTLSLGTGTVVPVLSGGGGILRFTPEAGEKSSQLTLDYGAGLKMVFGETFTGEIMVEQSTFRLDRHRLAGGYSSTDPGFGTDPQTDLWNNLSLRAGVGIQLGRRSMGQVADLDDAFSQRYQAPFAGLAVNFEPAIGRLQFDDATGLGDQDMIGGRAGLDFGSFFGLRGFYWQATESDFRTTQGMHVWGGEGQFSLAAGPGLNPHLVVGAGRMKWNDDFRTDPALIPAPQTTLILGGGVDLNFGPRIRATVGVRDFMLSGADIYQAQALGGASSASDLVHNLQYSAGLKFVVGGGGISSARPRTSPMPATPVMAPAAQPTAVPAAGQTATVVSAGVDSTAARPAAAQPVVGAPAVVAAPAAARQDSTPRPDTVPGNQVPRTLVIPIPEKGEIYIRFGDVSGQPLLSRRVTAGDTVDLAAELGAAGAATDSVAAPRAALTDDAIRAIIRQELAAIMNDSTRTSTPATTASPDVQALEAKVDELLRAIQANEQAPVVVTPSRIEIEPVVIQESAERRVEEVRPFTGLDLSGEAQALLGVALDIGPLKPGSSIRLVPTVALGFGEGPSTLLLNMGLEYRLPVLLDKPRFSFQPLMSVGPSLFKRANYEAAISTQLGAAVRIRDENGDQKTHFFVAYQGIDLFDQARLLVGLRRVR